ncbi:hypothetical protein PXK58_08855 [Phaeobacter gallaeciensis]|uniref:hypothetical protein n=1 Tax=Phaeobacter gallaeciensis TaxID=60890 RepID=UPI00237FDEAB|nr:hypothetical protein [Phaeobacter gallaeciensis]MDE4274766.1 hypothetical protein [Phaeobacter gallaeciensis]MDE4299660.1 hypothetical protein [Phaeobacter gallaeciensis]MDE5184825.1 hypothetical protein [Phaeobacter gallaeciensis]
MRLLMLLLIAPIAGCMQAETPEQRTARLLTYEQECQGYGFKSGQQQMAECVFALDQRFENEQAQRRIAMAQALQSSGATMQQSMSQPVQNTTCQMIRSTMYCNTY